MSKYLSYHLPVAPFLAITMTSFAGAADLLVEDFNANDGGFALWKRACRGNQCFDQLLSVEIECNPLGDKRNVVGRFVAEYRLRIVLGGNHLLAVCLIRDAYATPVLRFGRQLFHTAKGNLTAVAASKT